VTTIGISVAVPEPWGQQLQDYRVALGDESARLIPTHVTLVPPYEVSAAEFARVVEHLESVATTTASFHVHLRGTGTFRPVSPVVFINVVDGIAACEQVAERLRGGLADADLRFPYHPHVTIAHELDEPLLDRAYAELADFEASFEVIDIHLYEHDPVDGWRPTRSVVLAG
jgi:2'-5' RNA ligase